MRATFELNDKGTCNRFTRIRGIQKDHIFINEGKGGSKLRFEGTEAQFDYVMRDILGVHPSLRTTPIFVTVELPNLSEIQEHITVLTNKNKALKEYSDHLEGQIASIQASRPVDHPFPVNPGPANREFTEDAGKVLLADVAKLFDMPVEELVKKYRDSLIKPDVGLPVGPEPAGKAPKGKPEPGPAPAKLTRAEWLKLSPQAKRDLAALPKPVKGVAKQLKEIAAAGKTSKRAKARFAAK